MNEKLEKFKYEMRGKSAALIGFGKSNRAAARFLKEIGMSISVFDGKALDDDAAGEAAALCANVTVCEKFDGIAADLILRSPGIRPDLPELNAARERGSVITSEMELFLAAHPCPVYAITGSDGKTTTTTLTSLLLEPKGKVFLGGNIGEPLLHRLPLISEDDAVAVELSSFQLMTVDAPIDVAAITNITPNHLNWHVDMQEYIDAKARILRHAGRAVLNYENEVTCFLAGKIDAETPITWFSLNPIPDGVLREIDSKVWLEGDAIYSYFPGEGTVEIMTRRDIKLPGLHNVANYMTAIAATLDETDRESVLPASVDKEVRWRSWGV